MLNKSKTNSIKSDGYKFQPVKYDKDGNLYCKIEKSNKIKLTGIYNFEKEKFEIIWIENNWLTNKHKKLLNFFLKGYDWV